MQAAVPIVVLSFYSISGACPAAPPALPTAFPVPPPPLPTAAPRFCTGGPTALSPAVVSSVSLLIAALPPPPVLFSMGCAGRGAPQATPPSGSTLPAPATLPWSTAAVSIVESPPPPAGPAAPAAAVSPAPSRITAARSTQSCATRLNVVPADGASIDDRSCFQEGMGQGLHSVSSRPLTSGTESLATMPRGGWCGGGGGDDGRIRCTARHDCPGQRRRAHLSYVRWPRCRPPSERRFMSALACPLFPDES